MEPILTSFAAFKLTAEELLNARHLAAEQRAYYQTLLSDAAEEKLGLMLDPYRPLLFTQQEAYLRGQIDILNMLLNESNETVVRPKNAVNDVQPDSK
jgi:hypothetical protein